MFAHSYYWNFPSISYDLEFLLEISSMVLQVNRIRELPQNSKIVATHTDSPDVCNVSFVSFFFFFFIQNHIWMFCWSSVTKFQAVSWFFIQALGFFNQVLIWDVEAQPNRHAVLGAQDSRPDLVCFQVYHLLLPFFFNYCFHLWQCLF